MFAENQGKGQEVNAMGFSGNAVNAPMPSPKPPQLGQGVASAYKVLDDQSRQLMEHAIRVRKEFAENGPIPDAAEEVPQNITQALAIINVRLDIALRNLFQIEDSLNS